MNQIVAVIGQNPFRIGESFHANRIFAALIQLLANLFYDGLNLLGIISAADDKEICKSGDVAQIKNAYV